MKISERWKRRKGLFRLFRIWQKTGDMPFQKGEELQPVKCPVCGALVTDFYCPHCGQKRDSVKKKGRREFFKGSFDNIPFLNDDAKRTFVHLLLRPGYMIRDYLDGKHSNYLSPMTALIIFYAFFALFTSIVAPELGRKDINDIRKRVSESLGDSLSSASSDSTYIVVNDINAVDDMFEELDADDDSIIGTDAIQKAADFLIKGYTLANLDKFPELVDTPRKASLAAFLGALRSQGIQGFLGKFVVLTLALWLALRKRRKQRAIGTMSFSAAATTAAYILCQYCFAMLFCFLITWGHSTDVDFVVMALLLVFDFSQLFGTDRRASLRAAILTGVMMLVIYIGLVLLTAGVVVLVAIL